MEQLQQDLEQEIRNLPRPPSALLPPPPSSAIPLPPPPPPSNFPPPPSNLQAFILPTKTPRVKRRAPAPPSLPPLPPTPPSPQLLPVCRAEIVLGWLRELLASRAGRLGAGAVLLLCLALLLTASLVSLIPDQPFTLLLQTR